MTWIPVSERLPNNDRPVRVKIAGNKNELFAWFNRMSKNWIDANWQYVRGEITHWQELEPPKEEG